MSFLFLLTIQLFHFILKYLTFYRINTNRYTLYHRQIVYEVEDLHLDEHNLRMHFPFEIYDLISNYLKL